MIPQLTPELFSDLRTLSEACFHVGIFTGFFLGWVIGPYVGCLIEKVASLVWDSTVERSAWVRKIRERAGIVGCDYCRKNGGCDYCRQFGKEADHG